MSSRLTPTTHAIILAAGFGSRLQAVEGYKILAHIAGRPLIDYHLENFSKLGVTQVTVVTGHEYPELQALLEQWEIPASMTLNLAYNAQFDRSNGISVLSGLESCQELPFWLVMADHIFEPQIFDRLSQFDTEQWQQQGWQGVLAVDYKLDSIFDMPDANKVHCTSSHFAIGKDLTTFEMIDTGLFWCAEGFVNALKQERHARNDCSTSDAVRQLIATNQFGFWDVEDGLWQDVDTPEARQHAEKLVRNWR